MQRLAWRNIIRLLSLCVLLSIGLGPQLISQPVSAAGSPSAPAPEIQAAPWIGCGKDDFYATHPDTPLVADTPGVLANDGSAYSLVVTELSRLPSHGTVVLLSGGHMTYRPQSGFKGTDTFSYFVKCVYGDGSVNMGNPTVTIVVEEGSPIQACGYDDETFVSSRAYHSLTSVFANDGAGRKSIVSIDKAPAHGVLNMQADGTFTYTSAPDFWGFDSFTYAVGCNYGDGYQVGHATVFLSVHPPCTLSADSYTTPTNTTLNVSSPSVMSNDLHPSDSRILPILNAKTPHGILSILSDGTLTYTPDPDFIGIDTYRYSVNCQGFDFSSEGITFVITPKMPIAPSGTTPVTGVKSTEASVGCTASDDVFTTPQDTALSVATPGVLINDTGTNASVSYVGTSPSHGTVTQAADGSFTYTPDVGYVGVDSYTYVIGCTDGSDSVGTVTISVMSPSMPDATPVTDEN